MAANRHAFMRARKLFLRVSQSTLRVDAINAFEHQHELIAPQLSRGAFACNECERAALETLVEEHVAVAIPVQQLDMCACSIHEHKDIAGCGIALHVITYDAAETIETVAHVGDRAAEEESWSR